MQYFTDKQRAEWAALISASEKPNGPSLTVRERAALHAANDHILACEAAARLMRDFVAQNAGRVVGMPNLDNVYHELRRLLPETVESTKE